MHDRTAEDTLGSIDVRVVVLHGTNDTFAPKRVASSIPRARLVWFTEASHALMIEQPSELGAFLARTLRIAT